MMPGATGAACADRWFACRYDIIGGTAMKRLVVFLALSALAVAPVLAQEAAKKVDVTGSWELVVEMAEGPGPFTIAANYKQDGETLTGTHVSEMGEAPLKGTVKGSDIEYTINIEGPNGAMSITHKGKIEGDTITGTADFGMGTAKFTAKRKK
jgi:hypothetical protein